MPSERFMRHHYGASGFVDRSKQEPLSKYLNSGYEFSTQEDKNKAMAMAAEVLANYQAANGTDELGAAWNEAYCCDDIKLDQPLVGVISDLQKERERLESLLAAKAESGRVEEQGWTKVEDGLPERGKPIEMTGDSGYIAPHDHFVISGYYDPEFRPYSPWLDSTSTCTSDMGWNPTHWRYLTGLPASHSQPSVNATEKMFYVIHKPSALFWRPKRCGYTKIIEQAGKYSREEAEEILGIRDEEAMFPCEEVESVAIRTIDFEMLLRPSVKEKL